jgi:hypothetical protein
MLTFKKIEEKDLEAIKKHLKKQPFRTCDFTIFGIFLWADHYNYEYCVYEDTFFLKGRSEEGLCDYAVPFGSLPTEKAIEILREYCAEKGGNSRFNFVPQSALKYFEGEKIRQLEGWSDYVYAAEDLKNLKGRKFNKKRNRLNKFMRSCTDCKFEPLTPEKTDEARAFFKVYLSEHSKEDEMFEAESLLIKKALDFFFEMEQTGGLLYVNGTAVAMTIGEVIGDTLYVHVEKALRQYDGAYEAINYAYANRFAVDGVNYINREEDMGDEGIRQAKMAYNPIEMINKYEVRLK